MLKTIQFLRSPNFSSRRDNKVNSIIFYATGKNVLNPTLRFMTDPKTKISCHFIIPRNKEEGIVQLVETQNKAWHAGRATLAMKREVNLFSIGIQLVGYAHEPFTAWQYEASTKLVSSLIDIYPDIDMNRIVGHDMISDRPNGPGQAWSWELFFDKLIQIRYGFKIDRG